MRYQSPSIEDKLKKLISQNLDEIVILLLFLNIALQQLDPFFDEISGVLKNECYRLSSL